MDVINGWTINRDAKGFWLVAGAVRDGPYPRKYEAQNAARGTPAPPPKPVVKPRRKLADGEST